MRIAPRFAFLTLLVFGSLLFGLGDFSPSALAWRANPSPGEIQATFTVINDNDGGAGSLRAAIEGANTANSVDIINFDAALFNRPRTIDLASALPAISGDLTINGPGANLLTVRRLTGGNYRILTINSGVVTLNSLTIANGNAGASDGGGILNGGGLTVTNCHITGNTAAFGGGISNQPGASLVLRQSTISNNLATGSSTAGGITGLVSMTITNSTISGNIVTGSGGGNGGGLRVSNATIENSMITNNSAAGANSAGGLMVNVGTATLRNTLIAANQNNESIPDVFTNSSVITSGGYNLIGNRGSVAFAGTSDQSGTGAARINPLLAPLGDFGGTTPVHALQAGSPALDKGSRFGELVDQRGRDRRFNIPSIPSATSGDESDIGAVEMQALIVTNDGDTGIGSLRQAILDAPANSDILFDATFFTGSRTITFSSGLIIINKSLNILGTGSQLLTLSGNNVNRIFRVVVATPNVTISDLTIANGRASDAGGGIVSDANLTLNRCEVVNNALNAGALGGGGVYVAGSVATFTECTFSGNTSPFGGGAITLIQASANITRCTINGNTANVRGGGLDFISRDGRRLSIINSTISANSSPTTGGGGALYTLSEVGSITVEIINSTIVGNTGADTAGIRADTSTTGSTSTTVLRNSIIANSSGPNLKVTTPSGGIPAVITSQGYNLANDNGGGFLTGTTDQINTNPLLGPLQNNGGLTPTHAPLIGSPTLDKGSSGNILTDQRGFTRPFDISTIAAATGGDNSDIGAVEVQAVFVANADNTGTGSLRQTILDAPTNSDILFDPAFFNVVRTVTLSSGEILISKSLTITGPGANLLTLSGNNINRIFRVASNIGSVSITDLTIANGRAGDVGGGIVSDSDITLTRCRIINNASGPGFSGGGVYVGGATAIFTDCTFTGNTAAQSGGGVVLRTSSGTFTGCTFNGNTANSRGGGLAFISQDGRKLRIINSTISGNNSVGSGGGAGLFTQSEDGAVTTEVVNSTIVNNNGVSGGGIRSGTLIASAISITTLRNTIIANNSSPNITNTVNATITSLGYNLTSDGGSGFITGTADQINTDPLLGQLQNNGGLTLTHALLDGSPALDKGQSSGSTTDQRGVRRPMDLSTVTNAAGGDGADIGAFERGGLAVVAASSFRGNPVAQESIVAIFGAELSTSTVIAGTVPLPTTLNNTRAQIRDALSGERDAPLFFVSPNQVNAQIPPGTAIGPAIITIFRSGTLVATTALDITAVEPSLFTANSDGMGAPAAQLLRIMADGTSAFESVGRFEGGKFVPAPISLGQPGDQVVLVFYGLGIRNRSLSGTVTINIGNTQIGALFAGAAPDFIGLDQVNSTVLQRSLAGIGTVPITLSVDGKVSNTVMLNFQ
jgi:uncharacterized protein (TIGR03437 family)